MGRLGIFGGTSLLKSSFFSSLEPQTIPTDHGPVIVYTDPRDPNSIAFIQRHHADASAGASTYRPPHLINHRANLAAMKALQVDRIIAVCCVGSLSTHLPIGTIVFPDDYFYLFGPSKSFYDDSRAHIVPSIDSSLRSEIITAVQAINIEMIHNGPAVYVQTVGPRFETKAEIRFLSPLGDVVGMTAASEATFAKELGIPYAILAMIDNMANGLAGSELTHEQFKANVAANQATVEKAVSAVLTRLLP